MARSARATEHGLEYVGEVLASGPATPRSHWIRVERHPEFDFEPVQATYLSLRTRETDDFSDYRTMSLASSPTRDHLEYGARMSDSAWKQAFQALDPGDEVMVEGPVGDFVLDETRPAVLVAGGIGITPLKGMAEYAADRDLDQPVRLLYSNRSEEEIAFRDELEALVDANPRFEVVHTLTRETPDGWSGRTGRIDGAMLAEVADGLADPAYYVCGTPGMVRDLVGILSSERVPSRRIRYEQFWGY